MFLMSDGLVPSLTGAGIWLVPLGSHLDHKTQTSAGVLVGPWQTSEWRGMEKR